MGTTYERQLLNAYKTGFKILLSQTDLHYKTKNNYLKLFDKVITTKSLYNIHHNLKITDVRRTLDNYAKQHNIQL